MFKLKAIEGIKTGQVVASDIFKGKQICRRASSKDIANDYQDFDVIGIAARDIKKGSIVTWRCRDNTEDILIHG